MELLLLLALLPVVLGVYLCVKGARVLLTRERGNAKRAAAGSILSTVGLFLVIGAIVALGSVWSFSSADHGKGRTLRLRGRSRLPRRRVGEGWSDETEPCLDGLTGWQRSALGEV